ncbi:putative outer membrane protein precursor [Acetonema longum DSM 6540]|uniref:Putative outer membrane protein n=2 Tax=Acetonema TaxID=2373 RepID=F7NLW3_9FIRM|nr:putative outer membrane protein precursor [Acetonema longum DSM 6540]
MTYFSHSFKTISRSVPAAIATFAIAISWAPAAAAQAADTDRSDAAKWGLGAGVALAQKPYRDMDRDVIALPLISYENKWISASVATLDLKLFSNEAVSWRLRVHYAGDGYEADDSPFLAGMNERKGSVWIGGAVNWKTPAANFSAELLGDASGHSNGSRARLQVNRRFPSGSFGVTPRLAVEWVDRKFVDYYYGVEASEMHMGRGFYEGTATANAEAGLRVDYSPTHRYTVFLDLRATRFGSAIKDSPLVGSASRTAVSVGYLYRF